MIWLPDGVHDVTIASSTSKTGIALRALSPRCSGYRQLSALIFGFGGFTVPQLIGAVKKGRVEFWRRR